MAKLIFSHGLIMKKQVNNITKYLLRLLKEKRPDDNIYQLSKRTGIPRTTLYNRFQKTQDWSQAVLLMRICADVNITMEEALICERIPDVKNSIIDKLESANIALSKRNAELESELKKLRSQLDKIKKSLQ